MATAEAEGVVPAEEGDDAGFAADGMSAQPSLEGLAPAAGEELPGAAEGDALSSSYADMYIQQQQQQQQQEQEQQELQHGGDDGGASRLPSLVVPAGGEPTGGTLTRTGGAPGSKLPKPKGSYAARIRAKQEPKLPPDLSKKWNPFVSKPQDTSLALRRKSSAGPPGSLSGSGGAAGQGAAAAPPPPVRSSSHVSSPTRDEREKRKAWAAAAAKRQAAAAQRLLEREKKAQAEAEARMEARKAAVRARIEQEKEALARIAAKRQAGLARGNGEEPPGGGTLGGDEGQDASPQDPRHVMRKRAGSPRPLYLRLQEEYERRQQQEQEETRKKLELQAAIRQVRVQALMNGEVVIRPLPDEVKPPKDEAPRWQPAGRGGRGASPGRQGAQQQRGSSLSPHRSRVGSVNGEGGGGDAALGGSEPSSPARHRDVHVHKERNGTVLYSMHEEDEDGAQQGGHHHGGSPLHAANGGGNRRGKLVTRREQPGATTAGRFGGNGRRHLMQDRACSPFVVDPATQQVLNAPPQEQFWQHRGAAKPHGKPSEGGSGTGARRLGALEQAPPPPPTSRLAGKASHKQSPPQQQQHEAAAEEGALSPSAQQLEDAIEGDEALGDAGDDVNLGESFAAGALPPAAGEEEEVEAQPAPGGGEEDVIQEDGGAADHHPGEGDAGGEQLGGEGGEAPQAEEEEGEGGGDAGEAGAPGGNGDE